MRLIASTSVLVGALVMIQVFSRGEAVPVRKSLDGFPATFGRWQGRELNLLEDEVINILKVKDYVMRRYVDDAGRSLWLYIGYHDSQRTGAQFHSPKNCLPGAGWEPVQADRTTVEVPGAAGPIRVNRYLIQKQNAQQLVVYWYQSQGRTIASELEAKIQMVKNAITRNRTDGALVRISTPVYGSPAQTFELQARFIRLAYPVLGQFLPD